MELLAGDARGRANELQLIHDVLSGVNGGGKTLMAPLRSKHPDRFSGAQLRTMQRRVKEWRGIMAKNLVYASLAVDSAAPSKLPELVLIGADSRC